MHDDHKKIPGFDPDGYYSSHLALGDLNSLPALIRGHQYKWTSQGTVEYEVRKDRPNKSIATSMNPILFEVGMPKNILASPINGAQLDTGIVNFELRFNDIIQPPMPPFKIIQFDENHNIKDYTPRKVNEYGLIQVSKYKDFRENIMAKGHVIQINESEYYNQDVDNRMLNSAGLMNALYANIHFEGRFTDTATYYWRFGWYINPDALPTETISFISLLMIFIISLQ
ncbi:MAG: hypothetical protein IPO25_22575 [Saprospiraceae bacterium]|nr:hypothetical protein [Saprospiraceae bacterium]